MARPLPTHPSFEIVSTSAFEFKVIFKNNDFKEEVRSHVDVSSMYEVPPYLHSKELPFNLSTLKDAIVKKAYLKENEEAEKKAKELEEEKEKQKEKEAQKEDKSEKPTESEKDEGKGKEVSEKDESKGKEISNKEAKDEPATQQANETKEEIKADKEETKEAVEEKGEKSDKAKDVKDETEAKKEVKERDALEILVEVLDIKFADFLKMAEDMIKDNKITFPLLPYVLKKKTQVAAKERGSKYGAEITDIWFGESFFGDYFAIKLSAITTDGEKFFTSSMRRRIYAFEGMRAIKSLPFQPMDDATREYLTKRGETFVKYAIGFNFLNYQGTLIRNEGYFEFQYRADGRVMVDARNFKKFNPAYEDDIDDSDNGMDEVAKDKLFLCKSTFRAFSFYAKKWGEILVENLSEITFMDDVFARLVLAQEKKKIIKSVIRHSDNTFADVIGGKGAGIIFLFHGSPGVGKTLTAEAVAEMLHTPLYMVSVGELGTDAASLEKNLREILEVSRAWNAVALIDEADIFLEKRTERDINRNAMVGVFLRMLEYHQGILILTTNRVKSFDEAFFSRITLAFKYDDLDGVARHDVWKTLLGGAKINLDLVNVEVLAAHELNGRQIKNVIKLAQALALEDNVPIATPHFETAIKYTSQFRTDLMG